MKQGRMRLHVFSHPCVVKTIALELVNSNVVLFYLALLVKH